jgi:curved DNA-binding protein CbpA
VVSVQGQLNQKPIIKLFRQLSEKKANGLLRVTRGKTIKAIFFEAGNPVFAISNSAQEQIEYKLLQEKLVSAQQVEQARTLTDKPNKISAKLIEIGAIHPEILQKSVREMVKGIIFSLIEWNEGEYVFDEKMRAAHEIKLDHDAIEILLEAGRQISKNPTFSQIFLPAEVVVVRTPVSQNLFDTGKLVPIESYILSRIDTPTVVQEVGALSGLPEEEAYRALCALAASGFLRSLQDDDDLTEGQTSKADIENLKQEIINKTNFFSQADYYEILDVLQQATTAEIKAAYYNLAKKFHPDRFRQPEYAELRHQLESMFAKITQAYETLSTGGSRSAYDSKIKKEKKSGPLPKVSKPLTAPIPIPLNPSTRMEDKRATSADSGSKKGGSSDVPSVDAVTKEESSKVAAKPIVEKPAANAGSEVKQGDSNQMAERYYQQGRSRIDKKDYSGAIQLLREAVKLEPGKSHYHYYLGSALIRSPRNRREAEDHLAKAAKLDQFNTNLKIKIGMLFKESGNRPKADLYFKDALSLDPDNRIAKRELRIEGQSKNSGLPIWKQDMGSIAKKLFKRG